MKSLVQGAYFGGITMAERKTRETKTKETQELEENDIVEAAERTQASGNFIYIGKKGAMAYVLAVVTQFGMGAKEVIIKARGKSISRAVDVAEIVRNRDNTMKLAGIGIATEEVVTQDGRPLKVSSIEITLKK
ncbi:DNA/RNA-binding protein Alba [uncultured archaeon]|nr:DNA/RNA-binding protein Alba [uncultured archaeon]